MTFTSECLRSNVHQNHFQQFLRDTTSHTAAGLYVNYRSLKDSWQAISDQLVDTQQQLKASMFQLSSHEENVSQFRRWLLDAENKLKRDLELQPSLQAKKALLQNVKVISFAFVYLGHLCCHIEAESS